MTLPPFYAFSGCDYNVSFNWISKVKPLKLIVKDESTQREFSKLNEWNAITEDDTRVV